MRRGIRRLVWTIVVFAVLLAATYPATMVAHLPPPHELVRLELTEPSAQGGVFAARAVPATTPRAWPTGAGTLPSVVRWKGDDVDPATFLRATRTRALVVVRDGTVTDEWYDDETTDSTRVSSWSVVKSVVSLLVGQAVGRGLLAEDDRLVDVVPQLRNGTTYDDVTIRDLLDMASGVDVSENYREWWPFTGAARMFLTTDLLDFVRGHRAVSYPPGSQTSYRSVDTELLGMALAAAEDRPLAELLADGLWGPIGAESGATWNLDRAGGVEKAFCCLNATARDFARIGQLVLDRGRVHDRQVVPEAWIDRVMTPVSRTVDDWGYSAQWWHVPVSEDGTDWAEDATAIGIYGQYIHVDPANRTVIVKLSDYGTEQDEWETVTVLRQIAAARA